MSYQVDLSAGAPAEAPTPTTERTFESVHVAKSTVKVSGAVAIDAFDKDISLDDRVRAVGTFRVVKVNHIVGKDGEVVREQVLAPCDDMQLVPFDPSDPNDDGIVRMRP